MNRRGFFRNFAAGTIGICLGRGDKAEAENVGEPLVELCGNTQICGDLVVDGKIVVKNLSEAQAGGQAPCRTVLTWEKHPDIITWNSNSMFRIEAES